ncbi:MAG: RnfABCDGE type electron transport complex subunit B [Treponema sp.]|nr:RnfABCDGE type electron transport complex subunit B [Treponema sp.]
METIYIAVFSVTLIGIICAAVLCIASKFMQVKIDPRINELTECMPGVNCGACGYPGCSGYALALLSDNNIKTNLCTPGGFEVLEKISRILGVETGSIEKKCAIVFCSGDFNSRNKKMEYAGIKSCEAAKQLYGGENSCANGCLGYGDCKTACPGNAICMEGGLARIITNLCTGCALCVKACPNALISVLNTCTPVFVLCKNTEKGSVTRKKCSRGCIGCGKCARECRDKAITIENNLAVINYEKCSGCNTCIEVCVVKCIKGSYLPAVS